MLGRLAGERPSNPDSPRATGLARAGQGVPYAAVLHAFRIGGRFIWELLVERSAPDSRDVLLRAAADIWAVSDDLSSQVTDAYGSAMAERARRDGQMRAALVGTLLDGESPVTEDLWERAALLNVPREGTFVVVAARCPAPGTEALAGVERMLQRHGVVTAWRLEHDHQDGLVALRVGFGIEHLVEVLAGMAVSQVGVSAPFVRLENAADGRRQARLACAAASRRPGDVVRFEQQPLAVLLAAAPDRAAALAAAVLGPVLDLSPEDRAVILQTAHTWLATGGSSSAAADQLHVHRNTVRYRLRRIEELTGRDLARPVDASEVYVALECVRILGLA